MPLNRDAMGRAKVRMSPSSSAVLAGEDDLSTWSEEELIRGQKKSSTGKWVGTKPSVVPRKLHDELVKRKMTKAYELLRDNLVVAVEVLVEIAKDPEASHSDRLKASTLIIERVLGKPTETVNLSMKTFEEAPWQKAIRLSIVGSVDQASQRELDETISDAEVIEPDDAYPPDEFDDDYVIDPDDEIIDPIEPPNANNERYPPGPYDARWRRRDV